MRAQKLRWMKFIFDRPAKSPAAPALAEGEVRNILVLRLDDKLGDSITATGFLREIKKAFPQAKLSVVAGPLAAQIYQGQAAVDQVFISKKGLLRTWKLYLKLRGTAYDALINTSHLMNPRSLFLASRLKAKKKLGFRSLEYRLFTHHVQYDPHLDHVTTRYQNVLRELSLPRAELSYELNIRAEDREKAESLLRKFSGRKIVVLNSFAGARLRSLNEQNSKAIVLGLLKKAQDLDLVIVNIGNHNDLPVIEKWVQKAEHPGWVVFPGTFDFFVNCAVIQSSALVISPDTAIVHVASALKIPQVAIFRPDSAGGEQNAKIWAPLGAKARVVFARQPSSPASLPAGEEPDINDLNVDEVVVAALALLGS
jgi:ADP-heptose:LPS heptosyltransferase